MTLVAAFPVRGVPVLVGDFLLTDNQVNARNMFLPTRPELRNVTATPARRRIAGLRKKIHKIGDRLVVGFTGDLIPGEKLMKALIGQFGDKSPTKADLEKFLSEIVILNKDRIKLVGWIWEKRVLCFEWYGSRPNKVNIVSATYSGSGGNHFRDEIMKSTRSRFSQEITTELERATYMSVGKAGKILVTELLDAANLDHAYGFGAEVIIWDGGKFSYVDSVAYQFYNILVKEDNSLEIDFANIVAVYKNFDTYSAIQVSHIGQSSTTGGLAAEDTHLNIITPLNDDMPTFDVSTVGRLPFEASFWFTGLMIHNPSKSINAVIPHVSDGSDGSLATYKNGRINFNVAQLNALLPPEIFNA